MDLLSTDGVTGGDWPHERKWGAVLHGLAERPVRLHNEHFNVIVIRWKPVEEGEEQQYWQSWSSAEAWSRGHWASEARLSLISWIFFCLLKLKSKHWTASGDSFWFHLKLHETGLITRVNQLDSLIDQLIIADDAQEEWITWNYRLCNWSAKPQAEHLFFLFSTIAILMF